MKTAIYRNPDGSEARLTVQAVNADKTVELVNADGAIVIGKCPVGDGIGQCRNADEPEKKTEHGKK
jgi:hypothetical protein